MLIFSNAKSEPLAKEVASEIGAQLGKIERMVFPDGEIYVRLTTPVKGEEVALIHTTQDNNDLIELILVLSALKGNGAKKVRAVIPHLVYQRQDTAFKEGEAVSAKVFLETISRYSDEIIMVNAHFLNTSGRAKYSGVKITNLDAFPLLGLQFKGVKDLVIFSPDEGSADYAKAAASAVGCPSDYLIKKRLDGETVEMQPKKLNVSGKNVVILDDIISTGGTMIKAAEMLRAQGAKSVSLGCVHGVFAKGTDIFKGLDVITTNSIPGKLSRVSLAPIIAEALK